MDWEGSVPEETVWFQEAGFKAVTPYLPGLFTSGCELAKCWNILDFGEYMVEYEKKEG